MAADFQAVRFPYRRSPDQDAATPAHHPVVIVGAGPVGLTAAIDLARLGHAVLLLDEDDRLATGSRAICFAKRTLEIWDRLGCGQPMVDKGVSWSRGRVLAGENEVYAFDLLAEPGHRRPAFVNLQQYYAEGFLLEHASGFPSLEIRWQSKVVDVRQTDAQVELAIETPEGSYTLTCGYLIAADGARSAVRRSMGLESKGRTFRDRFLIADVKMEVPFPTERRFWFDPPFHPNQSVLLHRQPDNVWRVDFQLGWEADPEEERKPERVIPRIRALLGQEVPFTLEWVSVYTFSCVRMERFRHGRVLFTGDAAHSVSPFGARGANSGVQDADNLAWKLDLVLSGSAPERLLDSYAVEREQAADENIRASTRSTDFITPKSPLSRTFRDATLALARTCPFARRLVNSGRLSVPSTYATSPLTTPDVEPFSCPVVLGGAAIDAPIRKDCEVGWLIDQLGDGFVCMTFTDEGEPSIALGESPLPVRMIVIRSAEAAAEPVPGTLALVDVDGLVTRRYDGRPGTTYLFRPDQHVAARWRRHDPPAMVAALAKAVAHD